MSGIFGLTYRQGRPVSTSVLEEMSACLAHRGPDGAAIWVGDTVGLGHRRLATTPESLHEQLPLTNRRGDLTITADVRLDNRAELMSEIGLAHGPSDAITDSEIVLAAYERWGEASPEHLLGDFAFAIWDERRGQLFCPAIISAFGRSATTSPARCSPSRLRSRRSWPRPRCRAASTLSPSPTA